MDNKIWFSKISDPEEFPDTELTYEKFRDIAMEIMNDGPKPSTRYTSYETFHKFREACEKLMIGSQLSKDDKSILDFFGVNYRRHEKAPD